MTHRVLLVDDEPLARRGIRARLRRHPDFVVAGECGTGEEAVALVQGLRPDLVFLDVEMPGMTGLDVLRAVGETDMPATIFTTAYAQYALEAFGAAAVDYLLKPLDPGRFERALDRARWTIDARRRSGWPGPARDAAPLERFWVKARGQVVLVAVEDVDWIQAEGDYARLHIGAQSYLQSASLTELEARLPAGFLRIHRSAVVNLRRVRTLVARSNLDHQVHLSSGAELRLSRTYYRRFREAMRGPGPAREP